MQRYYSQPYNRLDDPLRPNSASGIALEPSTHGLHLSTDDEGQTRFSVQHQHADPFGAQSSTYEPLRLQAQPELPLNNNGKQYGLLSGSSRQRSGFRRLLPNTQTWSRRRGITVLCTGIVCLILIVAAIAASVGLLLRRDQFSYTPSFAKVTNDEAFWTGGANVHLTDETTSTAVDEYTYFSGTAMNFPNHTRWISFEDMWTNNLHTLQTSCKTLGYGSDNSQNVISEIYDAIQNRANASLVDHRFIFAVILQESKGCVHIKTTISSTGVRNPGIMQSHDGSSYSSAHSNESILAMVQDGTQGTAGGDGLVQNLNRYGNPYKAARGYNSGYIPKNGNLSQAAGATACYVSDIANRLLGWVNAVSKCPGDV